MGLEGMHVDVADDDQLVQRVAAIDVAKASGASWRTALGNNPLFPWKSSTPRCLTGPFKHQVRTGVDRGRHLHNPLHERARKCTRATLSKNFLTTRRDSGSGPLLGPGTDYFTRRAPAKAGAIGQLEALGYEVTFAPVIDPDKTTVSRAR
jgi:hypothetical protein